MPNTTPLPCLPTHSRMKAVEMHFSYTYLLSVALRCFTYLASYALLLSVPSEFWVQALALLEVPAPILIFLSPFIGATCWTIVEVIQTAKKNEELRKQGKIGAEYHDPTAKYWPLKIFVGSMLGLFCRSVVAPAIIAVIPKVPEWGIGFLAGAVGYWFMSKKLPNILSKKENENDA